MARLGFHNDLRDIAGLAVGHHHRMEEGWGTGTTAVLTPPNTVGSVDIRGGGPATRDTDALAPDTMVQTVDAVCLTGGSAYGLDAAGGVMANLEQAERGFRVGVSPQQVVPIVGTAALFDLGIHGAFENRPDASFGFNAAEAAWRGSATDQPLQQGSVGAGAGATAGVLKGGVGMASAVSGAGFTVAALVVVNAAGSPVDPRTGLLWGVRHGLAGEFDGLKAPSSQDVAGHQQFMRAAMERRAAGFNTTLAVLATDAVLSKAECRRLAGAGHDGMARSLDPIHGYVDGDIVFGLATGQVHLGQPGDPLVPSGARLAALGRLLAHGANAVARAVVHATLHAQPSHAHPCYREMFPSSFA